MQQTQCIAYNTVQISKLGLKEHVNINRVNFILFKARALSIFSYLRNLKNYCGL